MAHASKTLGRSSDPLLVLALPSRTLTVFRMWIPNTRLVARYPVVDQVGLNVRTFLSTVWGGLHCWQVRFVWRLTIWSSVEYWFERHSYLPGVLEQCCLEEDSSCPFNTTMCWQRYRGTRFSKWQLMLMHWWSDRIAEGRVVWQVQTTIKLQNRMRKHLYLS